MFHYQAHSESEIVQRVGILINEYQRSPNSRTRAQWAQSFDQIAEQIRSVCQSTYLRVLFFQSELINERFRNDDEREEWFEKAIEEEVPLLELSNSTSVNGIKSIFKIMHAYTASIRICLGYAKWMTKQFIQYNEKKLPKRWEK